jgi:hypothetical protein
MITASVVKNSGNQKEQNGNVIPVSENTINLDTAMDVMSQNLNNQDSPRVGIFWYDIRHKDLFGVVSAQVSETQVSHGLASVNTLHVDWWKKQYNKLKFKNNGQEKYPFIGDYKDTPRGRIFYNVNDNIFVIKVGSWINTCPEAKDLIRDEFNLDNEKYQFEIDQHWEIGFGWEGW